MVMPRARHHATYRFLGRLGPLLGLVCGHVIVLFVWERGGVVVLHIRPKQLPLLVLGQGLGVHLGHLHGPHQKVAALGVII